MLFRTLWLTLILAVAATAFAQNADEQEESITLPNGVVGTFTRPVMAGTSAPTVLMLHGFASQKDEVGNMYKRLAEAFAAAGLASFRIDFRGGGESEGDFADTTIASQVEDALAALQYLQSDSDVDSDRIGLLGFSLGGGVAITAAGQQPEGVKSLAVWSSIMNFDADMRESLGQANVEKALREGVVTVDLGWRSVTLKDAFFESLKTYYISSELPKYMGPFLAVGGGQDPLARYVPKLGELAAGSPKETLILPDSDHTYLVLSENQVDAETVIRETTEWFATTLK